MHIIDRIRFVLKDKNDYSLTKDEKIKMIDDSLDELTINIPHLAVVKLDNDINSYQFTLPSDFDEVYTVNFMNTELQATYVYNLGSLVEGEHYVIAGTKLILTLPSNFGIPLVTDISLNLTYYKKFNYIKEDVIESVVSDVITVTDGSIYSVGQELMIGEGAEEKVYKVKLITGDNITLDSNIEGNPKRIILNLDLDNVDLKILEYSVQTMFETIGTQSNYTSFKWKTDKIEETYVKDKSSSGLRLQGTTAYGALQKRFKQHPRYKFNRNRLDTYTLYI